jgi:fatty acid desaturase
LGGGRRMDMETGTDAGTAMDKETGRARLARYSLAGPENQAAALAGLAGASWFRSAVPRQRMKELMRRSDYPAVRDTVIWLGLIGLFAGLGIAFWGSWLAAPFLLAYGLRYGSTSDSRWHESGHGTAFRTRWLDEGLYQVASFMIMRDPATWRWSHTQHHTDTLIVGRDRSPDDSFYAQTATAPTRNPAVRRPGHGRHHRMPQAQRTFRLHQRQGARRPGPCRRPHLPGQGHRRRRLHRARLMPAPDRVSGRV